MTNEEFIEWEKKYDLETDEHLKTFSKEDFTNGKVHGYMIRREIDKDVIKTIVGL